MQEKIMEALKNQGFRLEKEGEMGYCFEYESLGLLYLPNENDDTFLNLAVPNIWEADGEQVTEAYAVVNQINASEQPATRADYPRPGDLGIREEPTGVWRVRRQGRPAGGHAPGGRGRHAVAAGRGQDGQRLPGQTGGAVTFRILLALSIESHTVRSCARHETGL